MIYLVTLTKVNFKLHPFKKSFNIIISSQINLESYYNHLKIGYGSSYIYMPLDIYDRCDLEPYIVQLCNKGVPNSKHLVL